MSRAQFHQLTAYALFTLIAGAYALMALKFPIAYLWATYEDLYGEWAQVYLFAATLLCALTLSSSPWRYRRFFILLAIACFYVFMEEISWGQRLFGFSSPEFFQAKNLQGETNLHNFLVGPYRTLLKTAIEYIMAIILIGYGLLYPLAMKWCWQPAHWWEAKGIAPPPLYLWPFFTLAAFLELSILSFNEAEVAEILVGSGLTLMSLHYIHTRKSKPIHHDGGELPDQAALRLASRFCLVAAIVIVLSALTTSSIYSSPEGRQRIDRNIEEGIVKFAHRYARYEDWDSALTLFQVRRQQDPTDPRLIRLVAQATRMTGDQAQSNSYLKQALEIDLRSYRSQPDDPQINQSLAQTYELLGDQSKTQYHLQQALRAGLAQIKNRPDSGMAAYSLGRTYELLGRNKQAFEQFKRAAELNPESEQFRRAYLEQKRHREG